MATYQIPAPKQMDMKGDMFSKWTFFKSQWENYEIARGLHTNKNQMKVAMLLAVVGKGCRWVQLHLGMSVAHTGMMHVKP